MYRSFCIDLLLLLLYYFFFLFCEPSCFSHSPFSCVNVHGVSLTLLALQFFSCLVLFFRWTNTCLSFMWGLVAFFVVFLRGFFLSVQLYPGCIEGCSFSLLLFVFSTCCFPSFIAFLGYWHRFNARWFCPSCCCLSHIVRGDAGPFIKCPDNWQFVCMRVLHTNCQLHWNGCEYLCCCCSYQRRNKLRKPC